MKARLMLVAQSIILVCAFLFYIVWYISPCWFFCWLIFGKSNLIFLILRKLKMPYYFLLTSEYCSVYYEGVFNLLWFYVKAETINDVRTLMGYNETKKYIVK